MTSLLPVLLAVFAGPIVVGVVAGAWSWWLPRHRLAVVFRRCRRDRLVRGVGVVVLPVLTIEQAAA